MQPSVRSFAEELCLIKLAEEDPRPNNKAMMLSRLKSALQYGAGFGLGTGASMLLANKFFPKKFPVLTPKQQQQMGLALTGLGGLGALASNLAERKARKLEDAASKRNR